MVYCTKCGKENDNDAKFCVDCGTSIYPDTYVTKRKDTCFGEDRYRRDFVGLVSFGLFLIIIGIVYIANPSIFSDVRLWIEQMVLVQGWIRPPSGLLISAILFFSLTGLSTFLMAVVRFLVNKDWKRALADVASGTALVVLAFLLSLYESYVLRGRMVLTIEVIVCGLLVIFYSLVRYVFLTKDSTSAR